MIAAHRRIVPTEPVVHSEGNVGVSSRWWYLPGMYQPTVHGCRCCSGPESAGQKLARRMAEARSGPQISSTEELYGVPYLGDIGDEPKECVTWPRYHDGEFSFVSNGSSMLELTVAECQALRIIMLITDVRQERYGSAHQLNWKKVGLSRASFTSQLATAEGMPTARAAAAFRFLLQHNQYYRAFHTQHQALLASGGSRNISSYALFVVHRGIECAMYPWLYPTTAFTDTGILEYYRERTGDTANRVCSIGQSWTRKVLSSVRVYGEQRDLPFFLYEKHLAAKYFNAQVRAKALGVTGDVMTRDSQATSGYWEVVADSLADLVRIMLVRCFDQEGHPLLYQHCRNLRGEVWLCAFPNVFITIAPAEWKFPRPYFLERYKNCIFAGAYIMALHMYFLVRCIWLFLAARHGHRFFVVFEWCFKTEYQGRGTPHWHIAAWVVSMGCLAWLQGRTGTRVVSAFVNFLRMLFCCEIDVQIGNGRLNYINGYVSKDHDAVDVGLGEYVQKSATSSWLAAYRLLSKSSPCLPEVAIRMAHLSEFERSYVHVLLYPPQPAAVLDVEGRKGNFSQRMYGFYLREVQTQITAGIPVSETFLVWHCYYYVYCIYYCCDT